MAKVEKAVYQPIPVPDASKLSDGEKKRQKEYHDAIMATLPTKRERDK